MLAASGSERVDMDSNQVKLLRPPKGREIGQEQLNAEREEERERRRGREEERERGREGGREGGGEREGGGGEAAERCSSADRASVSFRWC